MRTNVHGGNGGCGAGGGSDGGEGRSTALIEGMCLAIRLGNRIHRRRKTYGSLDVPEGLAGREGRRREPHRLGDGDDLRAVGEGARVMAEGRELDHDLFELGDHACVVG